MTTPRERKCTNCAAPLAPKADQCGYCGVWYEGSAAARVQQQWTLPKGAGEFGVRGRGPIVAGVLAAFLLYGLGWLLEDFEYWLDDRAIAVWAGALPLWLGLIAFAWRAEGPTWHVGLGVAVPIFLIHLAVMMLTRGRFNDDHAGIAAMFAGAALGGWIVGRVLHTLLRRSRARSGRVDV